MDVTMSVKVATVFVFFLLFCRSAKSQRQCLQLADPNCQFYANTTIVPDSSGATTSLMFNIIKRFNCSADMGRFLCAAMYPSCDVLPKMPCRSFCEEQSAKCAKSFTSYGMEWPFNCSIYPNYDDSRLCITSDMSTSVATSNFNTTLPAITAPTVQSFIVSYKRIRQGQRLRLICQLNGKGLLIHWMFNAEPLVADNRVTVKRNILKISDTQKSDEGVYQCKDQLGHSSVIFYNVTVVGGGPGRQQQQWEHVDPKPPVAVPLEMYAVRSNLTSLWRYVKRVEQKFEGGVHLHTGGRNVTRRGNQIDINLNVVDKTCEGAEDDDEVVYAACSVKPNTLMMHTFSASQRVYGEIRLEQKKGKKAPVKLDVHLSGFNVSGRSPPYAHGFHIHTHGNMLQGCESVGTHFNPMGTVHGSPKAEIRHHGDLGNIHCDKDGDAVEIMVDHKISLRGRNSVIGRSIVIHEGPDDMGLMGTKSSRAGGNAGARLACCVIGRAHKP